MIASAKKLQEKWTENDKLYYAIVHGKFKESSGRIVNVLAENAAQVVYVSPDPRIGKRAETEYTVVHVSADYSELEVRLFTGRKNQIRVQFAYLGHPIVGDPKYGNKGDKIARMALHAKHLAFNHPFSGRRMVFDAPIPAAMQRLIPPQNKKIETQSDSLRL